MSVVQEPEVKWSPEQMVEVVLREPDDFLKVRETLTRIWQTGLLGKRKRSISLVTSCISRVDTIWCILRNCLPLMGNMPT